MDWDSFGESFAHDEHRVMGRKLRPFCLYYRLWMRIIGSPFVHADKPVGVADLELASRLCSCAFGEAEKSLRRRPGRIERWARALWMLWPGALEREAKKMIAYLRDTATGPDYAPGGESREEFPMEVLGVAALMMHGKFSREDAWMLPFGEGVWMRAAFDLLQGGKPEVLTPEQKRILDHAMAEQERRESHKAEVNGTWDDDRVFAFMVGEVDDES